MALATSCSGPSSPTSGTEERGSSLSRITSSLDPRDHYATLGVASSASTDEIRAAYRGLARVHHPDRRGGATSPQMAAINEAWRVLSDPARRAAYDASRRVPQPAAVPDEPVTARPPPMPPARFPWRGVAIAGILASVFVVVLSVVQQPVGPRPVDNVLAPGSCVVIEANGDAREVRCDAEPDGVVELLVPFDARCPAGTSTHRDRQGMGWACVTSLP